MKRVVLALMVFMSFSLFSEEKKLEFGKKDNTGDGVVVELTIEDAVNLALKNNLGLETEKLKVEQKKWALYTSWNTFIPGMSFTTSMVRLNNRDKIESSGVVEANPIIDPATKAFLGYTVYPYSVSVEKPEFTPSFSFDLTSTFNAAMVFSIYNTAYDYRAGKLSLETAEKKLMKDVKSSFFSLLLLEEVIKSTKNQIATAEQRYKQTQTNYKNGLVPELNVFQSQVVYENIKPTLYTQINNYETAKLSFKQSLGIKRDVNINLKGSLVLPENLEEYDAEKLIEKYIDNRLDVQSLNHTLKTLNNVKNINIASLTPSFIFKFSADPTFKANIGDSETWKYSSGNRKGEQMDLNDLWKQSGGMLMFAVSLPLDSWVPFSSKQMGIVNANFNIKQSEVGLRQLKLGAELEIESLVMKIRKSKASINNLKMNVELARKTYKLYEDAYKAGSKEYLEVKQQEDQKTLSEINLLQEEYNYLTAILDLQYATNSSLNGDIEKK